VLVFSNQKQFQGLAFKFNDEIQVEQMKPKPTSWVLQAASQWKKSNNVGEFSSYFNTLQSLSSSVESFQKDPLLGDVRDEHIRVHLQD
jgi:hypothetical protein